MTIDSKLVGEAVDAFGKKFEPQVKALGYQLGYGHSRVGDSYVIAARIQSRDKLGDAARAQVVALIPKQFEYNTHTFSVDLKMASIGKLG